MVGDVHEISQIRGARLWMALNVYKRILIVIWRLTGSQWSCWKTGMRRGGSGDDVGYRLLDHLTQGFVEALKRSELQ